MDARRWLSTFFQPAEPQAPRPLPTGAPTANGIVDLRPTDFFGRTLNFHAWRAVS
jgi:hypothetical protein